MHLVTTVLLNYTFIFTRVAVFRVSNAKVSRGSTDFHETRCGTWHLAIYTRWNRDIYTRRSRAH